MIESLIVGAFVLLCVSLAGIVACVFVGALIDVWEKWRGDR